MIIDFLKTTLPKQDLEAALRAVRAFKECESQEEWFHIQFAAWAKLEQLEEFLKHLVEGVPLADDTIAAIKRAENQTSA